MVLTPSQMVPLGTKAPEFHLPDVHGRTWSLADFDGAPALVVVFMCNHCPYVKHIRGELARLGRDCASKGVGFVGINANDAERYPADSPAKMKEEAETYGYEFPYLFDATQDVAKAYAAACTPDCYLFDGERRLVYRGQLDDARPGGDAPNDGRDLRAAIDAVLRGEAPSIEQTASIGCNIKWRVGNEPGYFG
jgi:peroxiredoxin